jgi:hypothetical protein
MDMKLESMPYLFMHTSSALFVVGTIGLTLK